MNNLVTSIFRPEQEIKGCVEVVHGMEEHRKRYDDFAKTLVEHGYAVITYDLPGHGETGKEEQGYFGEEGWNALVNSVEEINQLARKEFPNVPIYLFGHSMGSMVSRCYLQEHDANIKAVVLSGAPCYQSATSLGIFVGNIIQIFKGPKGHSKLLDNLVTGAFNKVIDNPRTTCDWISYNEDNVDAYLADPMSGIPFTVKGYIDELKGMSSMHDYSKYKCTNPDLPILFVAGEDDPCTGGTKGLEDSINTLKKVGYKDIDLKRYSHMRHEILNEKEKDLVKADIISFLDNLPL